MRGAGPSHVTVEGVSAVGFALSRRRGHSGARPAGGGPAFPRCLGLPARERPVRARCLAEGREGQQVTGPEGSGPGTCV